VAATLKVRLAEGVSTWGFGDTVLTGGEDHEITGKDLSEAVAAAVAAGALAVVEGTVPTGIVESDKDSLAKQKQLRDAHDPDAEAAIYALAAEALYEEVKAEPDKERGDALAARLRADIAEYRRRIEGDPGHPNDPREPLAADPAFTERLDAVEMKVGEPEPPPEEPAPEPPPEGE
jgi:hypothetical protein